MSYKRFLYEQRITQISQKSQTDINPLKEYVANCRNDYFLDLEKAGAKVICLFQGVIGIPTNVFLQLTRYSNFEEYHKIQINLNRNKRELIDNEQVSFLTNITPYPKDPFPIEDDRPIYSNRSFFIHKKDINLCAELSYEKVWPLYESWGCGILGLFSSLSYENLHKIKLFAGYKSISHWEKTRDIVGVRPEEIDAAIWEQGVNAVLQRAELTLKSNVSLMRRIYLPNNK